MPRVIFKGKGIFDVESFTIHNKFYEVDLKYGSDGVCTCNHFKKSNIFCKHIKEVKSRIEDNLRGIEGLN